MYDAFVSYIVSVFFFFFSSRRRHTRCLSDWSSDVCSSDLIRLDRISGIEFVGPACFYQDALDELLMPLSRSGFTTIGLTQNTLHGDAPNEIGRASCRERV